MKRFLVIVLLFIATFCFAADRSNQWSKVRKEFLKIQPICQICGIKKDLQVHHIMIFSRHPELELDMNNYITVCTSKYWGVNCHLLIHGGSFYLENPWAKEDVLRLHVLLNPAYIKENTDNEYKEYVKMMQKRIKKYNCDMYNYRCSNLD